MSLRNRQLKRRRGRCFEFLERRFDWTGRSCPFDFPYSQGIHFIVTKYYSLNAEGRCLPWLPRFSQSKKEGIENVAVYTASGHRYRCKDNIKCHHSKTGSIFYTIARVFCRILMKDRGRGYEGRDQVMLALPDAAGLRCFPTMAGIGSEHMATTLSYSTS